MRQTLPHYCPMSQSTTQREQSIPARSKRHRTEIHQEVIRPLSTQSIQAISCNLCQGNYCGLGLLHWPPAVWIAFTTIFAFNCSRSKPFAYSLFLSKSEDSILVLNILSHGTLLLLGTLTLQAFETVRWALASSRNGIPAGSFLGLSRATGLFGVLRLFVSRNWGGFLRLDGQQFWGVQRYYSSMASINESLFLLLVNGLVGIALLSHINVVPSWRSVETIDISASGLTPINATIAQYITARDYWAFIYSLLPSTNYVFPVPPTRCSLANNCESYYLSGGIYNIYPSKSSFSNDTEATLFIIDHSIGYLVEYYPPSSTDHFNDTAECGTYGSDSFALHICVQEAGSSLLAGKFFYSKSDVDLGLSYCPFNSSCLNNTSWNNEFNSFSKVAISELPATVVYSRLNNSILDIRALGNSQPVHYSPNDFFAFFNVAGDGSDLGDIEWVATQQDSSDPYENWFILMAMMTIPVARFNDATFWGSFPPENLNTTGSLAVTSYRVYSVIFYA